MAFEDVPEIEFHDFSWPPPVIPSMPVPRMRPDLRCALRIAGALMAEQGDVAARVLKAWTQ